ncbi:MAG TPA: response regulator [Burkholderiales bacterium]|nr:response regulator [Burkholderiales bacterium]
MRVLIAEDDEVLADGLERYLQQAGYVTERVGSGAHADSLLATGEFDLVILDIGLPGIDGFEVLRRLRARRGEIAVLILTARDAVEDRVRGLDLGADDYLVKPFALLELEARLRAIVRRGQPMDNAHVSYGALTLDLDAKRAWLKGEPIRLTAREWRILEFLILRAGKMVSKDQIVAALSAANDEVSYSAIEVHISHLRQKIEAAGVRIRSIRGFGYYLET